MLMTSKKDIEKDWGEFRVNLRVKIPKRDQMMNTDQSGAVNQEQNAALSSTATPADGTLPGNIIIHIYIYIS